MLLDPGFARRGDCRNGVRRGTWSAGLRRAHKRAEQTGTVDADVGELFQMRRRDVQRLVASHRKPRNRTTVAIRQDAVILFDIRHDVRDEILRELIWRRRFATAGRRRETRVLARMSG